MTTEIKTFEDACKKLGIDAATAVPTVTGLPAHHQEAIVAHSKLVIIAEALNEGWKPNWSDWDENKYYPWFEFNEDKTKASGFGLAYFGYANWYPYTYVGSRLCFKSRELAKYAGNQFIDLYEKYFLHN